MGKAVLTKHIKSVKHVWNSEGQKSSSAAILAFWTGGKTLQTNKLHNNVTDSSSKNPEVTIDQAPTSQNLDVPNQGIS